MTPTNNPYNSEYCDACDTYLKGDECACHNDGGWGWYPFHNEETED
jgi:hypothetical protein